MADETIAMKSVEITTEPTTSSHIDNANLHPAEKWTRSFQTALKRTWKDILLTLLLVIITTIISYVFKSKNIGMQAYQSFDLTDRSLSFAHSPSRISGNKNIFITSLFVLLCWVVRSIFLFRDGWCRGRGEELPGTDEEWLSSRQNAAVSEENNCKRIEVALFGLLFLVIGMVETNMLTNTTKTLMGGLKPHFVKECDPKISLMPSGVTWVDEVLTREICENVDTVDYRRSFPSGHVTQATYSALYGILEIQCADINVVLKRFVQLVGLAYTFLICCYRITGHHHHWYDVLAGLMLGITLGVSTFLAKQMKVRSIEERKKKKM